MSSIDRNAGALIALVQDAAAARRNDLITAATVRARALVHGAHEEARQRMRRAFDDERRRARERLGAARAELDTRRRLAMQRRTTALLAACWKALPDAMVARWRDDRSRTQWVASAVRAAREALPAAAWRIAHADGWPPAERERLADALRRETGRPHELAADPALGAGLEICADGTTIDATLGGLIADRNDVGASLLQHLESAAAGAKAER